MTLSEAARRVFEELAGLDPGAREARLLESHSISGNAALGSSEVAEIRSLLSALDASPGFLDSTTLAWSEGGPSAPSMMRSAQPGARFGSFTLIREVGRGGMGVVYEAEQDRPRRRVALKLMRPGPVSPANLTRFKREAEALGRLSHPNIAAVYEARMTEGDEAGEHTPYIAMEFVRGSVITDYARERHLGAREVVRLMADACDAVAHAHAAGIVHRDLSPSNLLVDGAGVVKVVDFGVASIGASDSMASLATTGHHVFGKWAYMSPEQAGGDASRVDPRTDVFSLGATLYELLAGRAWLDAHGRSVIQLARAIERDEPAPLGAIRREARGDLQAVVSTAMRKDRAGRYPSVADLRDELRRWLAGQPVHAREPGWVERLGRFAAQNRALVGAVAATFTALSVGLGVATAQWVRATRSESRLREMVRAVLNDVVAASSQSKQSLEVRAAAMGEVRPIVDQYLESSSDDPGVRALASIFYTNLAGVQGIPFMPNRGDREGALALLRRAISVAAPNGLGNVGDEACAAAGLDALNNLENMFRYLERASEGEEQAVLAVAVTEKWLTRTADRPKWLFLKAQATTNLIQRFAASGKRDRIAPLVAGLQAQLIAEDGDNISTQMNDALGAAWLALLTACARVDVCEHVPDACARARPLLKRRAEGPKADPNHWLDVVDTWRFESSCLARHGRTAEALECSLVATGLAREAYERFPQRVNMSISLETNLSEVALLRSLFGDPAAVRDAEEAIRIAASVTEDDANKMQREMRVCNAHLSLARAGANLYRSGVKTNIEGRDLLDLARASVREIEDRLPLLEPVVAERMRAALAKLSVEGI